jgi:hypothetical protein
LAYSFHPAGKPLKASCLPLRNAWDKVFVSAFTVETSRAETLAVLKKITVPKIIIKNKRSFTIDKLKF